MLHWSVSWSIFLLYSTFLRPLVDVLFWVNRVGWKRTAIFYLLLWCEKGAWDALRWKGWNQQEEYHPFFFKLLKQIFFFSGKTQPSIFKRFLCVCPHFISSCLTVSNFNKSFLCVILHPTYPSIFILHPPFPTYRLHGGILRCAPSKVA